MKGTALLFGLRPPEPANSSTNAGNLGMEEGLK